MIFENWNSVPKVSLAEFLRRQPLLSHSPFYTPTPSTPSGQQVGPRISVTG